MISLLSALTIFFSPLGGCEAAIIKQLTGAKKSVSIQAYSFTNLRIVGALTALKERGIKVRVILDKSYQTESPIASRVLQSAGIEVLIDAKHAIAHNKIIIIDDATVITGSYNFTNQAEHMNAENLLVLTGNAKAASAYVSNFNVHAAHSIAMPSPLPTPVMTPSPEPSATP